MAHPYNCRYRKTLRRKSALERLEKRIAKLKKENTRQGLLEKSINEAAILMSKI